MRGHNSIPAVTYSVVKMVLAAARARTGIIWLGGASCPMSGPCHHSQWGSIIKWALNSIRYYCDTTEKMLKVVFKSGHTHLHTHTLTLSSKKFDFACHKWMMDDFNGSFLFLSNWFTVWKITHEHDIVMLCFYIFWSFGTIWFRHQKAEHHLSPAKGHKRCFHFPLSLMNNVSQTEPSVFQFCRFSSFPNDPFFKLFME